MAYASFLKKITIRKIMRIETLTSQQQAVLDTKESLTQQMQEMLTNDHKGLGAAASPNGLKNLIDKAEAFIDIVNQKVAPEMKGEFESDLERMEMSGKIRDLARQLSIMHQKFLRSSGYATVNAFTASWTQSNPKKPSPLTQYSYTALTH